jgi:hypothetical protein
MTAAVNPRPHQLQRVHETGKRDPSARRLAADAIRRESLVPNLLNYFEFSNGYGEADSWFESCSLHHAVHRLRRIPGCVCKGPELAGFLFDRLVSETADPCSGCAMGPSMSGLAKWDSALSDEYGKNSLASFLGARRSKSREGTPSRRPRRQPVGLRTDGNQRYS